MDFTPGDYPNANPWPNSIPSTQANVDPTDNRNAQLSAAPYQVPPMLLAQNNGNLSAMLQGQIPQSDVDFLRTKAAEFGVGTGTAGSEFAANSGLRSLGLMQLDQNNRAAQLLNGFYNNPMQFAQLARRPVQPGTPGTQGNGITGPVRSPMVQGYGGNPSYSGPTGTTRPGNIGDSWVNSQNQGNTGITGGGALPWWASNKGPQVGTVSVGSNGTQGLSDSEYNYLMGYTDMQPDWVTAQNYNPGLNQVGQNVGAPVNWGDTNEDNFWGGNVSSLAGGPMNYGDTNEDNFWGGNDYAMVPSGNDSFSGPAQDMGYADDWYG